MGEYKLLPQEEQISDDFGLLTDGEFFYAVRTENEGGCPFILRHKDKWIVISDAVHIIHQYIENLPEPPRAKPYWDDTEKKVKWATIPTVMTTTAN